MEQSPSWKSNIIKKIIWFIYSYYRWNWRLPKELAATHTENGDKYNNKADIGVRITGVKRSWFPEGKMKTPTAPWGLSVILQAWWYPVLRAVIQRCCTLCRKSGAEQFLILKLKFKQETAQCVTSGCCILDTSMFGFVCWWQWLGQDGSKGDLPDNFSVG